MTHPSSSSSSAPPPTPPVAAAAAAAEEATSLAPGFRFHPTDEVLVSYYLKRKVLGRPLKVDAIAEVDLYKLEPWDLPARSRLHSRDSQWFFFSRLDRKHANRARTNRATSGGYWKTTGKDREVRHGSRIVGMKKTLVFHAGRAPKGERTNWVMHEYRLGGDDAAGIPQDSFVVCRIFQKAGPGPQNGAQYGAPFVEEEWEEDDEDVGLLPVEGDADHEVPPGPKLIPGALEKGYLQMSDLIQSKEASAMKQKTPKVKRKAPTAKRFRSLAVLSRSSGVRLMLSHSPMLPLRPMLCPKPSPPPATLIQFSASWENEAHLELDCQLKRHGIMSVLFETPSGFAIFIMREGDLKKPDAMQNIWRNFISERRVKKFILPCEFREFKDKSSAIHDTGMNWELAELITAWSRPGQKMAVGKPEYKGIIERVLGVPCLFNEVVMEVMWALQNLMHFLVPEEKMELRNEDCVPMSQGLKMHLNRYGFDVKPEMVNENVLMAACILFDYEGLDAKNAKALRFAGEIITDLSGIDTEVWDLMELATAVKIICGPAERSVSDEAMFTRGVVKTLVRDAHKYEGKIDKEIYLKAYHQIVHCRKHRVKIREILGFYLPACDGHQS